MSQSQTPQVRETGNDEGPDQDPAAAQAAGNAFAQDQLAGGEGDDGGMSASGGEVPGVIVSNEGTTLDDDSAYARTKWIISPGKNKGLETGHKVTGGNFKGSVQRVWPSRARISWYHIAGQDDDLPSRFTIHTDQKYSLTRWLAEQEAKRKKREKEDAERDLERDRESEYASRR